MIDGIRTHQGLVETRHCDDMGHLTVSEYYGCFGSASWSLLAAVGYDKAVMSARGIGFADVKHVLEFKHELAKGDRFAVFSDIVGVGRTSLKLVHYLVREPDRQLCAELNVVTVQFDLNQRSSMPLETIIRETAEARLAARSGAP
jgi:acyl-CoA thioester hydrolase